jgi:hypothetical protein
MDYSNEIRFPLFTLQKPCLRQIPSERTSHSSLPSEALEQAGSSLVLSGESRERKARERSMC